MSWISGLAGKAEDILNKIDQNAANVLQQPARSEVGNGENNETSKEKAEPEVVIGGLMKNLSSSSLSLTKSLTPKKLFKNNNLSSNNSETKLSESNLSSRRSSELTDEDVTETPTRQKMKLSGRKQPDLSPEKELSALRIALADIKSQRDELKEGETILQGDLDQARREITELEGLVKKLATERDEANSEFAKLKENCSSYLKTIGETDTSIAQFRQNIVELTEKLNWQMKETEQVTAELQEYRHKAKSTLKMKDKVIMELKTKGNLGTDLSETSNQRVLILELESLRQENSNLNDELSSMVQQLEDTKIVVQKLEERLCETQANASKVKESFENARRSELENFTQLETDAKFLTQEIAALREEISRERNSFSAQLSAKEKELSRLRKQAGEISKFSDPNRMEGRIESLTQALVKKQTAIETLTAEKNALKLQLEKTQEQLHYLMDQNRQRHSEVIYVNDTDDAKAQLPSLMRETPFDTNVARRMKRAYSSLDSAGIRMGVFLRRYPLVRIMVFIYVALLHLWVMFVLLSSTPS